ncbi:unnamed protein product [Prunus armeniaca]|uniref:Uncharacterized protein n=1 Tax=Prunus armeniaca TaxID=36596 RepID=A0A6J5XVY3_PRUAR|nr:unnamed protein product [Prunus armeniaca]
MTQKPKAGRGEVLERSRIANRRTTAKFSNADRDLLDRLLIAATASAAATSVPPRGPPQSLDQQRRPSSRAAEFRFWLARSLARSKTDPRRFFAFRIVAGFY